MVRAIAFALVVLLPTAACARKPAWVGETGISSFNPHGWGWVCAAGWDLRYQGQEDLQAVRVYVRYPAAVGSLLDRRTPGGVGEWLPVLGPETAPGAVQDALARRRVSQSSGISCPDDATRAGVLEAMKGTEVRVVWRTASGEHGQVLTITRPGPVRVSAGNRNAAVT